MEHFIRWMMAIWIIVMAAACNAPQPSPENLPATLIAPGPVTVTTQVVEQVVTLAPEPTQEMPPTATAAQPVETLPPTSAPGAATGSGPIVVDTDAFAAQLSQAMAERDVDQMRAMMGDDFLLAYWRSEGSVFAADQAANELRPLFAGGSAPAADLMNDASMLLGGADPYNFLPPNVLGVRRFLVRGLSSNASDEAIVYIAKEADGSLSFYGMLVAVGGYSQPDGVDEINQIGEKLAQVVQARDFDGMRSLMGASFSFVTLDTSLYAYPADEALNLLRQGVLADGSAPVLRFDADVAAMLGGRDPLGEWGPVAQPVRAVFVSGLGSDGQGEGVLVIARSPDTGGFYWLGILFPKEGSRFSSGE